MSYQSPTNHGAPAFPTTNATSSTTTTGAADLGPTSPTKLQRRNTGADHHHHGHSAGRYESPNHYRTEMPVPRSQRIAQQQAALQQQHHHVPGTSTPPDHEGLQGGYQPAHHVQPPPPPPYGSAPPPPYDPNGSVAPPPPHGHPQHHMAHHHHHGAESMGPPDGMPPPPPSYEAHVAHLPGSRTASPYIRRDGPGSGHFGSGHGTPSGRFGSPGGVDVPAGTRFRHDPYSPGSSRVATPNRRDPPMSPTGGGGGPGFGAN